MTSVRFIRFAFIYTVALIALLALTTDTAVAAYTKEAAKTAAVVETPDPIKDATVNLYCRLKAGKKIMSSSGSGVLIHERGVVLTNAHVAQYLLLAGEKGRVTGWCSVRTGSPAKEAYTAELLYISAAWLEDNVANISKNAPRGTGEDDFALLYLTGAQKGALPERFPSLPIGTVSADDEGRSVTVAGYPTEKLDFDAVRNSLARVIATSTISNTLSFGRGRLVDVLSLTASPAASGGVSGGPIVNAAGEVVGIVATKSTAKNTAEGATLRGITLPYIDRAIQAQTARSLASLLAGDYAAQAALTRTAVPPETVSALMNGLRKKK